MKQIKIVLAIFIALAMATPALALNVEWHGDLNNRASYSTQGDMSTRLSSDSKSYYSIDGESNTLAGLPDDVTSDKKSGDADFFAEIKYRTHLVVSDDENKVKGVIGLEIGSEKFGTGAAINGGDQTGQLELRWAYTDIELPFDAASRVSVGLQPVGYNMLLWSDNAAGVKWTRAEGAWKYTLGWWRSEWDTADFANGKTGTTGGSGENGDLYAADATYKFDTGAINGFMIYRDKGENAGLGAVDADGVGAVNVTRDDSYWLGLSGSNAWGDLSVMATGIYLGGTVKTDSATDELDREAFLMHVQGDYKMDKYTFTLGGLYASGDDDANDDKLENFDHIDMSTAVLGSVVIFDNYCDDNSPSQAFYLFDQGYKIIYAGAKYAVNAKTNVWAKYFWHNTAEDELLGDDAVGHEFVVGTSYQIMKGLKAEINAGYLVAGDALDALATEGEDADDIFRTDARLKFSF